MAEPRERPILFSGPMVRAILDGRKVQTRRLVKPQPAPNAPHDGGTTWVYRPKEGRHVPCGTVGHLTVAQKMGLLCPYGRPGDRLWVRETWALEQLGEDGERVVWQADRAAAWRSELEDIFYLESAYEPERWRPSIHMPRWASRLTLEVTAVRVERLHDISETDARAEGVGLKTPAGANAFAYIRALREEGSVAAFRWLWVGINGAESWDANPWVWVVEFRRGKVRHG